MNTRSYPRTLAQAFGPYTDNVIHEPQKAVFDAWIKWRQSRENPEPAIDYPDDSDCNAVDAAGTFKG